MHFLPRRSHCGHLNPNPQKYYVTSPPICETGYLECIQVVNTKKNENTEYQLHRSSKSRVLGKSDLLTKRRSIFGPAVSFQDLDDSGKS